MIKVRKSHDRGHANHGWLDSYHTFSFADYYDPECMGFSVLRVINEDRIAEGAGFDTHGHRDMEIISYVIEGALEHKDSMGNATVIRPGEIQRMTAGTGIKHSEFNHSKIEKAHFLQIWILPNQKGLIPSYDQKSFQSEINSKNLVLVASADGANGSVTIHQDVQIYIHRHLNKGPHLFTIKPGRKAWVQVISGNINIEETSLSAGDGASIESIGSFQWHSNPGSEFILFDLP